MTRKQKVLYVVSFILAPVTALILLLAFWTFYPRIATTPKKAKDEPKNVDANGNALTP